MENLKFKFSSYQSDNIINEVAPSALEAVKKIAKNISEYATIEESDFRGVKSYSILEGTMELEGLMLLEIEKPNGNKINYL